MPSLLEMLELSIVSRNGLVRKGHPQVQKCCPYLAVTLTHTRHVLPAISEEATPDAGESAPRVY
jgi:hypothetical protein